jgi:hypothetical protein
VQQLRKHVGFQNNALLTFDQREGERSLCENLRAFLGTREDHIFMLADQGGQVTSWQ